MSRKVDPEAYKICKQRGHSACGVQLTSHPPWDICKFCGVAFRFETKLLEKDAPK